MHASRRRVVVGGLVGCLGSALLALAAAAPAGAKGPLQVTITPPGGDPVVISASPPLDESDDEPRPLFEPAEAVAPDARFVRLTEALGLWETTDVDGALLPEAPAGYLGPELTVEWTMYDPFPASPDPGIVQTVYPLAEGGALVHTEGGQPYHGAGETKPGWFRAPDDLLATLEASGVEVEFRTPEVGPTDEDHALAAAASSGDGGRPWVPPVALGAGVVLVAAGLVAVRGRRRRSGGSGSSVAAASAATATSATSSPAIPATSATPATSSPATPAAG